MVCSLGFFSNWLWELGIELWGRIAILRDGFSGTKRVGTPGPRAWASFPASKDLRWGPELHLTRAAAGLQAYVQARKSWGSLGWPGVPSPLIYGFHSEPAPPHLERRQPLPQGLRGLEIPLYNSLWNPAVKNRGPASHLGASWASTEWPGPCLNRGHRLLSHLLLHPRSSWRSGTRWFTQDRWPCGVLVIPSSIEPQQFPTCSLALLQGSGLGLGGNCSAQIHSCWILEPVSVWVSFCSVFKHRPPYFFLPMFIHKYFLSTNHMPGIITYEENNEARWKPHLYHLWQWPWTNFSTSMTLNLPTYNMGTRHSMPKGSHRDYMR